MKYMLRMLLKKATPFKPQRQSLTEVLPSIEIFLRMFLMYPPAKIRIYWGTGKKKR